MAERLTGSVKWFNETKGFGFLKPDDGGADVFVHISAVHKSNIFNGLKDNEKLEYELEAGRGGKLSAVKLARAA